MPQEQDPATTWSQDIHHDALVAGVADEDFTSFLDLDNGFEQFQQIDTNQGHSTLETPMGRLAFGHNNMQELANDNQTLVGNIDMSYQEYQMYQQMTHAHHYQVPPTPVSAEMHATKYGGQMGNPGQILYDRHQASFTPLVSPAQTPLDSAFNMPDYVVADDFFSPLTSPVIDARTSYASTNTTTSPVDMNADAPVPITATSAPRKRGRKAAPPPPRPARSIKQSPAAKPQQKKRQFSFSSMPSERLEKMLEKSGQEDRLQPDVNHSNVFASSEDSVSPEPLSELLMRPPPLPSNTGRSPSGPRPQTSEQNLPATPAMIMRMPSKPSDAARASGTPSAKAPDVMEDIVLPDAVASLAPGVLPHIDTSVTSTDDQNTPTLSAKTPKLSADSTPRTSALKTQSNSSESVDKIKRPETRVGSRAGKKRQSVSSAAISPALRPKMSPSISPLVPAKGPGAAGISAETSALYLASKSNYQNILDGTHLPGVSYPDTLAENLSSKRTSHKIAEQGRRNRINIALKEIESLLPPAITAGMKKEKSTSVTKEGGGESPDKAGASNQGASKASTVEMAIVYIKSLRAELQETRQKLEVAERRAQGSSSGSQSSEQAS